MAGIKLMVSFLLGSRELTEGLIATLAHAHTHARTCLQVKANVRQQLLLNQRRPKGSLLSQDRASLAYQQRYYSALGHGSSLPEQSFRQTESGEFSPNNEGISRRIEALAACQIQGRGLHNYGEGAQAACGRGKEDQSLPEAYQL